MEALRKNDEVSYSQVRHIVTSINIVFCCQTTAYKYESGLVVQSPQLSEGARKFVKEITQALRFSTYTMGIRVSEPCDCVMEKNNTDEF